MQSSLVTALRSCVMLLSLVAVPLAAVFGTGSWPRVQVKLDELRQELVARLEASGASKTPATSEAVIDPIVVPAQLAALPGPSQAASPPPPPPTPPTAAIATPFSNPPPISSTPPFGATGLGARGSAGINREHPTMPAAAPSSPPAPSADIAYPLGTSPPPVRLDPEVRPAAYSAETPQFSSKAAPSEPADRAGWIQHRLQTLGADWYRLESFVAGGETFRFQCKMGSPTNPNYVRYFEATSPEPLRAMQHVLDQVDAWVVGRDVTRR